MSVGKFIAGVGALIWDPLTHKYLLLRRAEHRDFKSGRWECVTGRVDQGESYEQALHREVGEEIGAQVQIEFLVSTTHFYRGAPIPENELLGLIYGCTLLNQAEISPGVEHSEWQWMSAKEIYEFLPADHWLKPVLRRTEQMKTELPQSLRTIYREKGFEIG